MLECATRAVRVGVWADGMGWEGRFLGLCNPNLHRSSCAVALFSRGRQGTCGFVSSSVGPGQSARLPAPPPPACLLPFLSLPFPNPLAHSTVMHDDDDDHADHVLCFGGEKIKKIKKR